MTTLSGASNSIPFYCRNTGNIYFVSPAGNDGNNGKYSTQGSGTNGPWLTATQARASLAAGDVAYFRTGLWNQMDSGVDTIFYFHANHGNGTPNNSITVASYPGEIAQLGDKTRNLVISVPYGDTGFYYWTFSKFVLRSGIPTAGGNSAIATTGTGSGGNWKNWRWVGNDAQTLYNGGVAFAINAGYNIAGSSGFYFYGNYVHDCGVDYRGGPTNPSAFSAYGLYIEGFGSWDQVDIGWNEFAYLPHKGTAIHVYGHTTDDSVDHLYIHDNFIHHNSKEAIVLSDGDGNVGWNGSSWLTPYVFVKNAWVYNNIFAFNGDDTAEGNGYYEGVRVSGYGWGGNGGNFYIFNNDFYKNYGPNLTVLWQTNPPTAVQLNNNTFYSNGSSSYVSPKSDPTAFVTGSGYNLYFNNGAGPSWDTHRLDNADPQFVSATPVSYLDFQSQSASPGINAGTSSVSATVTSDFLGVARPQGAGYDIGAYEYVSGGAQVTVLPPAAPRGFRIQ